MISVVVKDFERPFFLVGGEVEKPGKVDLRRRTTLVEALTIAGGIKHSGKDTSVLLFRSPTDGAAPPIVVDVKKLLEEPPDGGATFWIGRGDLVYVPRTVMSKIERFLPVPSIGVFVSPCSMPSCLTCRSPERRPRCSTPVQNTHLRARSKTITARLLR